LWKVFLSSNGDASAFPKEPNPSYFFLERWTFDTFGIPHPHLEYHFLFFFGERFPLSPTRPTLSNPHPTHFLPLNPCVDPPISPSPPVKTPGRTFPFPLSTIYHWPGFAFLRLIFSQSTGPPHWGLFFPFFSKWAPGDLSPFWPRNGSPVPSCAEAPSATPQQRLSTQQSNSFAQARPQKPSVPLGLPPRGTQGSYKAPMRKSDQATPPCPLNPRLPLLSAPDLFRYPPPFHLLGLLSPPSLRKERDNSLFFTTEGVSPFRQRNLSPENFPDLSSQGPLLPDGTRQGPRTSPTNSQTLPPLFTPVFPPPRALPF